jgi:hypothetical protein
LIAKLSISYEVFGVDLADIEKTSRIFPVVREFSPGSVKSCVTGGDDRMRLDRRPFD